MTTVTLAQALEMAIQHHQRAELAPAMEIYTQILAASPNHPDALHLLGVAHYQSGEPAKAAGLIQRSLALNPKFAVAHNNLGLALWDLQQFDPAIAAFHRAIELQPGYVDALTNLGGILLQAERYTEALSVLQQAQSLAPDSAAVHNSLGSVHRALKALTPAEQAYRKALALDPNLQQVWLNLGIVLREQGQTEQSLATLQAAEVRWPNDARLATELGLTQQKALRPDAARRHFSRALQLDARQQDAHFGLACLDHEQGRYEDAERHFQAALALGRHFGAQINLANLYYAWNRPTEAAVAYRQTMRDYPTSEVVINNFANLEKDQGRVSDAIELYRHALGIQPKFPEALKNLGTALRDSGHLAEGLRLMEQSFALRPDYAMRQSWLFSLNYVDDWSAEAVFQAHIEFSRHYPPADVRSLPRVTNNQRPLKVGYVSGDFRGHSVAFFIEAVLRQHDRNRIEPYAYFTLARGDAMTERMRGICPNWRDVAAMNDAALMQQIRDDGIDILVDLAGHTGHNRLAVFARRAAPLQVTWLGYPNTTGLTGMDYRLTDAAADPPGFEVLSTEKLWRLPHSYFCYKPDDTAPEVADLPAIQAGVVTLGSCNVRAKLSPSVLQVWAEALQALPNARLLLKAKTLIDPKVQQDLRDFFAARGIASERLNIRGFAQDPRDHLATYNAIDLAVDSYPYNGATTTCEALWMGVPVVSWAGDRPQARMGASILTAAGLPELVAENRDDYLARIIDWASDLPRLALLRSELRSRLRQSPLLDATGFTRDLETAYQAMWQTQETI